MINYIIQVILFQALFLAVYDFILKKETFFQWNRAYLIFTSLLAYILPLLKSKTVQENIPQEYIIMLPEVVLSPESMIEKHLDWSALLFTGLHWVFFIGIAFASAIFIYKIVQLTKIIHQNKKEKNNGYSLVLLQDNNSAFSFFKYVFVGKGIKEKQQIINHELVHVKQKHSLDLLIFEFQKVIFWFNPFSYLFQNRIAEVHEFIADSIAISKEDKRTYFQGLLSQVFQVEKFAFVNSFYKKSILKKRIIMLGKNKSKEILKFKYLLIIPLLLGMLVYTSCETEKNPGSKSNEKRFTTIFMGDGIKTEKKEFNSKKEGYFDTYVLGAKAEGIEISISDLTDDERLDYESYMRIKNSGPDSEFTQYALIELENGNKVIQENTDWEGLRKSWKSKDYSNATDVPFARIDQIPIFPGCEGSEDGKKCFSELIQKHVGSNFDVSIANTLGLESGKTKVYVQFKIDKTGTITDIRARAPHKDLEDEAVRVISTLPQMTAGEHKGKKVNVKYTLPISLMVK